MNKTFKLSDIVNIRSGMVVPKTVNNDENQLTDAYVRMIGTSDFNEDEILRTDLEANVLIKPAIERNFLQRNEIFYSEMKFYSMLKEDVFLPLCFKMNIHLQSQVLLSWF